MKNTILPAILAMAATVVASNVLVQFLFGAWLTWGAFSYPAAFLITDITNRVHGPAAARQVVISGFVVGLACSLIGTQIMGEFGPIVTMRIAIGSATAFLVAQLIDVSIFAALRDGRWWRAPLLSTLIAGSIDTALFFSIAFSDAMTFLHPATDVAWATVPLPLLGTGPTLPLWVSLAVADWSIKLLIALVALIPFRILTTRVTRTP